MNDPWLVVIDPQAIFADPGSAWASPMWPQVLPSILRLVQQHQGRVIVTRFSPQLPPTGSWRQYYADWPFAAVSDDDPLYAVVPELTGVADHVVTEPTFGKWGPHLAGITGPAPDLVLAGVATDCCVIATALAAADAGAQVSVEAAACGGSTPGNHDRAVAVMRLFGPQIQIR